MRVSAVRRVAGIRIDAPPLSMGPGGSGLISLTEPAENFGGFMYREPDCMVDVSKLQLRAGSWCWNDSSALDYLQWMRLYPPDEHLVEVSAEVRRIPAWQNGPCRLFPMVVWDIVP